MNEERAPFVSRTGESRDDWSTPDWIFNALNDIFQFNIDLAADAENTKVDSMWFGPGSPYAADSLAVPWIKTMMEHDDYYGAGMRGFLNPPFLGPNGEHWMDRWMRKCYEETRESGFVVALIRFSPDVDWYHDWVLGKSTPFPYLRGRVNYGFGGERPEEKRSPTFPSQAVLFHPELTLHRPRRKGR